MRRPQLRWIHLLRYGLPAVLAAIGIALLAVGGSHDSIDSSAGITMVAIALFVWLTNVFARMSLVSNNDRVREAQARERFARTGRWDELDPREPTPAPPPRAAEPERTPSAAPPRLSRPYGPPSRIRSRPGAGGRARGRRPD